MLRVHWLDFLWIWSEKQNTVRHYQWNNRRGEKTTEWTLTWHNHSQSFLDSPDSRNAQSGERRGRGKLPLPLMQSAPVKHRPHQEPGICCFFSPCDPTSSPVCPQSSFLTEHQYFLASSLGMWGRVRPREAGSRGSVNVCLHDDEVSAFLNGCPVRVRRELWQARLLSASVMGEDWVLARGAGGAAGVWVAGGVLVQRHRELQILLQQMEGKTSVFFFQLKHLVLKTDVMQKCKKM